MLTALVAEQSFADHLEASASGSAYPAVSPDSMARYVTTAVTRDAAQRFEQDTMPLRRRAARALRESEILTELRDALLPELLSGRLRGPVVLDALRSL